MNTLTHRLLSITTAFLLALGASHAQVTVDWVGGTDDLWETAANWSDNQVPDSNSKRARFNLATNDVAINITADRTINRYTDGGSGPGNTHTLYGAGKLTLDVNTTTFADSIGIDNATTGDGGTFRIGAGKIVIRNSQGTVTTMRNLNSNGNTILFDTDSVLTINTVLRTIAGSGGLIHFNGTIGPSLANLQIGSGNAYFGAGHDSATFGADIVMLANSKLTINGGNVLSVGRKFQMNGNGELGLNSANAINGANFVLGGSNNLYLDVNTNQTNLGNIIIGDGVMTIDVDAAVTGVHFRSSYFLVWGNGRVAITGFKEGTIRFGTNGAGLNRRQLAAIGDGRYSLTADGYLTEASVRHWARFQIESDGYAALNPWIDSLAFVETAPFIWIEEAGWCYMAEAVGVQGTGWIYAFDVTDLDIAEVGAAGFGYSQSLKHWVYLSGQGGSDTGTWFYVL
jgi:hypothetical protein